MTADRRRIPRYAIHALGALLVVGYFAADNLPLLKSARDAFHHPPDDYTMAFERRVLPLRAELRTDEVYGFVADGDALFKYFETEHTVVPTILDRSPTHAHVVGVFDGAYAEFLRTNKLKLLRDLGGGVLLLEKAP